MANKHTTLSDLFTDIADAIRSKKGTTAEIVADNFPSEISDISTGVEVSGTKEITENGTYDVTNYASANVNVLTEIPITDLPITHCVYIAKGVLTTDSACELLLQGNYQFVAGSQNRHGMCISRPQTYARSNALQVTLAGDMADGSTSARWMRVYTSSIKGGSLTTQQLIGYIAAMYGGTPQDVTIYLCDEDLYNANPSAYPQLVDITQMVSASSGTLANKS